MDFSQTLFDRYTFPSMATMSHRQKVKQLRRMHKTYCEPHFAIISYLNNWPPSMRRMEYVDELAKYLTEEQCKEILDSILQETHKFHGLCESTPNENTDE